MASGGNKLCLLFHICFPHCAGAAPPSEALCELPPSLLLAELLNLPEKVWGHLAIPGPALLQQHCY